MRLNHIDIYSPVPDATATFFTEGLGLSVVETRGKNAFFRLEDDDGLVLIISPPPHAMGGGDQVSLNAQTYHIGFLQADRGEVDSVYARLNPLGYPKSAPRDMHGAYTFYVTIPGNILVEIGHRPTP